MKSQYQKSILLKCLVTLLRSEQRQKGRLFDYMTVSFHTPDFTNTPYDVLNNDELYRLGICPVPSTMFNFMISGQLAKMFNLSLFDEFVKVEDRWKLNVNPYSNGFLLPLRTKAGKYYALKVYRYPTDPKPFILRKREVIHA